MRAKIREVLDDCIADGLRSGYAQAYKYEDFPCEETIINAMEYHIWLEIDRKFYFDVEEVDRLRAKKKQIYEDLQDLVEREWVGLTDEEVEEAVSFPWHYIPFARAVEAKLKEKNT